MKFIVKIVIFSLCIANVHAELLIIKRVQRQALNHSNRSSFAQYFAPLDASDEPNYPAIAQVLLNYQWPMVIANPNLTPAEQDELLTADDPYAEENFIRRKLQEINLAYDVAFIPTCLYELFILEKVVSLQNTKYSSNGATNSPLDKAIKNRTLMINISKGDTYKYYNSANNDFYPDAFFYINNLLTQSLFNQYPSLQISFNSLTLSRAIEEKSHFFAAWLIHNFRGQSLLINISTMPAHLNPINFNQELSSKNQDTIDQNKIFAQVISLEYQARKENKGLLLRGSKLIHSQIYNEKFSLAGTTVYNFDRDILESYKTKEINDSYSISFGNSLLAGSVNDQGACAYLFLSHYSGYGLFINKKDYIQHLSQHLFFISPLSSIAALFAMGEMFHSRSTTAKNLKHINVPSLNNNVNVINKLDVKSLKSSAPAHLNMLIINRNPLLHAQLFSQYLADNMHIITNPIRQESFLEKYIFGIPDLSPEEQAIYDQKRIEESAQLRTNQAKAADYYEAIRNLGNHFPIATNKYRQKLDDERALNEAIQKIEDEHGKSSMETELS